MDTAPRTEENPSVDGFQRGAVAMIDALGFRGIWGKDPKKPSLEVLDTLKTVRAAVDAEIAELRDAMAPRAFPARYRNLVKNPLFEFRFLSDTLVIAASVRPLKRRPRKSVEVATHQETGLDLQQRNATIDGFMCYLVCKCICAAIQAATSALKPIAYRGVVSAGYFAIEDNFILGPAVDEAADLMEVADGALVWLAPSATTLRHGMYLTEIGRWEEFVIDHNVPLKDGRSLRTKVLDPFTFLTPDRTKPLRQKLLNTMNSDRVEVILKRQNTKRFFDTVDRERRLRDARKRHSARSVARAGVPVPPRTAPP